MDRQLIRDEVRRALNELTSPPVTPSTSTSSTSGPTNRRTNAPQLTTVVNRARQLISMNTQPMAATASSFQSYPKRRRLGHNYQKQQKQGEEKTHELVCVLPFDGDSKATTYSLSKEDIYLSGAVTLNTQDSELQLRRKILEVLSTRMEDITCHDFEFVKVLRKTVTLPAVKDGQEYNYKLVKTFMGQGKLYIRLTKSPSKSFECSSDEVTDGAEDEGSIDQVTHGEKDVKKDVYEDKEILERLRVIFPDHPEDRLVEACVDCTTIDEAINNLLDSGNATAFQGTAATSQMVTTNNTIHISSNSSLTGNDILAKFREGIIESNKVYPITFNRSKKPLREICRIYKTNVPNLARQPIVYFISKSGDDEYEEEAADVGGPKREFFNVVIEQILASTDPILFEGEQDHKVPVHSQQLILQDHFKMIGKVFAHSVVHGDAVNIVGLAKPVKVFLQTGCEETAAKAATMEDIPDLSVREMLEEIRSADETKLETLNGNDSVLGLLSESGISSAFVTRNNANQVIYEVMVYQVVQKRIRELQSIREGLAALRVDVLLNSHPKVMPILFPSTSEAKIDVEVLKLKTTRLGYSDIGNKEHDGAFNFFMDYLDEVSTRSEGICLKDVLVFITGSSTLPLDGITVQFHQQPLPDPDTCTKSVRLPTCYGRYEVFKSAFDATISVQGKGYGRI